MIARAYVLIPTQLRTFDSPVSLSHQKFQSQTHSSSNLKRILHESPPPFARRVKCHAAQKVGEEFQLKITERTRPERSQQVRHVLYFVYRCLLYLIRLKFGTRTMQMARCLHSLYIHTVDGTVQLVAENRYGPFGFSIFVYATRTRCFTRGQSVKFGRFRGIWPLVSPNRDAGSWEQFSAGNNHEKTSKMSRDIVLITLKSVTRHEEPRNLKQI